MKTWEKIAGILQLIAVITARLSMPVQGAASFQGEDDHLHEALDNAMKELQKVAPTE